MGPEAPPVVTGVLLTRNDLEMTVDAIAWHRPYLDALVVVDGSTDLTPLAVRGMADVVVLHRLRRFDEERNLGDSLVRTPWILQFDTDERFPKEFLERLKALCRDSTGKLDSFRFPRLNTGRRDWPDYQVRLYRREFSEWRGTPHAQLFHRQKDMLLDQWSCTTLDEYPIVHQADAKDWDAILKEREAQGVMTHG